MTCDSTARRRRIAATAANHAAQRPPARIDMAENRKWMIYGATGYTGRLVARGREAAGALADPRRTRARKSRPSRPSSGCPLSCFQLSDVAATRRALDGVSVVAHCAGPFAATSAPMIDACLLARTHYVDITGEIDVFVAAQRRHNQAMAAGIVVCPGVGFDVIPTDCVAACLTEALPDATHLALGFKAAGRRSPGTARTSIDGVRPRRPRAQERRDRHRAARPPHANDRLRNRREARRVDSLGRCRDGLFHDRHCEHRGLRAARRLAPSRDCAASTACGRCCACRSVRALVDRIAAQEQSGTVAEGARLRKDLGLGRGAKRPRRRAHRATHHPATATVSPIDGVLMAVRALLVRPPGGGYFTPSQLLGARCVERLPGCSAIRIE